MKPAQPTEQHKWLQKLLGEWTFDMGKEHQGTETVKNVGDLWIVAEGQGSMGEAGITHTRMTLGFDPDRGRFVGTWIGSMMTYMWVYDGFLDESGTSLILEAEGPSMSGKGTDKYRDVIEMKSDEERSLLAYVLKEGGEWENFMTVTYRRVSKPAVS